MTAPAICFAIAIAAILLKAAILFVNHSLDVFDLAISLAIATGLLFMTAPAGSSLWTIAEGTFGVRLERDGTVLYEGPLHDLLVIDEDRAVMTLRPTGGAAFLFPRRRVFHSVLSRIADGNPPEVEHASPPA